MMKARIATLATACAMFAGAAIADNTTLTEALSAAYENSAELAQARANLASVDENVAAARSGMMPQISGSYTFGYSNTGGVEVMNDELAVNLYQVIWNNGRLLDGVEAAKLGVLAARENLAIAEQNVLLGTISAFMNVRAAQTTYRLADNNVAVLQEQLRAANERFDVGQITRTDVSLTESRVAAARSNREASRALLLSAIASYTAIVGAEPQSLAAVPNLPTLPATLEEAEAAALSSHPSVVGAAINLAIAELDAKLTNKNASPSVAANVSAGGGRQGAPDTGWDTQALGLTAGLQVEMPIYQGGKLKSDRRRAAATIHVQQTALEIAKRQAVAAVQSAFANYRSAQASKTAVQQQIRATQIAYEGVREEAQLGARTTLDVLNAEQDLLTARSSLVNAVRDEQVAAYTLLAEIGALNAESLQLDVEPFDPEVNYNAVNKSSPLGSKRLEMLEKMQSRQ